MALRLAGLALEADRPDILHRSQLVMRVAPPRQNLEVVEASDGDLVVKMIERAFGDGLVGRIRRHALDHHVIASVDEAGAVIGAILFVQVLEVDKAGYLDHRKQVFPFVAHFAVLFSVNCGAADFIQHVDPLDAGGKLSLEAKGDIAGHLDHHDFDRIGRVDNLRDIPDLPGNHLHPVGAAGFHDIGDGMRTLGR